jgi:hypothetical protein
MEIRRMAERRKEERKCDNWQRDRGERRREKNMTTLSMTKEREGDRTTVYDKFENVIGMT